MSAQGGTIVRRPTTRLPVRPTAVLLAVFTAFAIGMTVVRLAVRDAGVEPAVSVVEGVHHTSHPAVRDRNANAGTSMPVQRLYPEGFGTTAGTSMPVQRLYPEGFDATSDGESDVIFDGRRHKW
jgi:hypothetical protein